MPTETPNSIVVVNPDGVVGTIEHSQLKDALNQGYSLPSPAQTQSFRMGEKYGNSPLRAGAEAALRSGTFGLSDEILADSGLINPEGLRERESHNPLAAGIGTGVGIVAPLLVAPEGALAKVAGEGLSGAAAVSPVVGAARLGRAVESSAAALLPQGESLAAKALNTVGSKFLGSAVEGAAYGLGNVVSEHALGDPDLNAEKAIGEIGFSSLLFGGLGGALGAGKVLTPEALSLAKSAVEKSGKLFEEYYPKASSFVSGVPEEVIRTAVQNRHALHTLGKGYADVLNEQRGAIEKLLKSAEKDFAPGTESAVHASQSAANTEIETLSNQVGLAVKEMQANPDIYPKNITKKLEEKLTGFLERNTKGNLGPQEIYSEIQTLKESVGHVLAKATGPEAERASASLKTLIDHFDASLQSSDVWGSGAARQAKISSLVGKYQESLGAAMKFFGKNSEIDAGKVSSALAKGTPDARFALDNWISASRALSDHISEAYKTLPEREFDKAAIDRIFTKHDSLRNEAIKQAELAKQMQSFGKTQENLLHDAALGYGAHHLLGVPGSVAGAAIGAYDMLKNPLLTVQRLAKVERLANKITSSIERNSTSFFKDRYVSGPTRGALMTGKELALSQNDSEKDFMRKRDKILSFANDPDQLVQSMTENTKDLSDHAPLITQGVHNITARGVSFLASKLPQQPQQHLLSPKYQVSQGEIAKFNQYYETVENPMSVMSHMKMGTLTPEHIEALQAVYPKLYQEMKMSLTEKLPKYGPEMDYQKKLMASLFLGADLDGSTSPQALQANQMVFLMPMPQSGKAPHATAQNLKTSARLMTPMQLSSMRSMK